MINSFTICVCVSYNETNWSKLSVCARLTGWSWPFCTHPVSERKLVSRRRVVERCLVPKPFLQKERIRSMHVVAHAFELSQYGSVGMFCVWSRRHAPDAAGFHLHHLASESTRAVCR